MNQDAPGPFSSGPWARAEDSRAGESSGGGPWGMIQHPSGTSASRSDSHELPGRAADLSTSSLRIGVRGLTLATPGWRLVAKLIDLALLGVAMTPGLALISTEDETLGALILLAGVLATCGVQWWLTARIGQSLGKKWTGLRIVSEQGRTVGFVDAVIKRVWALWLAAAPSGGLVLLIDPLFVFGDKHRCLHDRFAHTLVIEAGSPGDPHSN